MHGEPSDEAVKLVYSPKDVLQKHFSQGIHSTFAVDFVNFAEISRLSMSFDSVESISDAACNLITGFVAEMIKSERLVSFLVNLSVCFLETWELERFCVWGKIISRTLRAIIYATGGDPSTMPSASKWVVRIEMMVALVGKLVETTLNNDTSSIGKSLQSSTEVEGIVFALAHQVACAMIDKRRFKDTLAIAELLLSMAKSTFMEELDEYIEKCQLLIGRCLVGLNRIDESIGWFSLLIIDAVCINGGKSRVESSLETILQANEVANSANTCWKLCMSLLPVIPTDLIPELHQKTINYMLQDQKYLDAHDLALEMLDNEKRRMIVSDIVLAIIKDDYTENSLITHLKWGQDEESVKDIIVQNNDIKLLYRWRISRGNIAGAAECLYSYAKTSVDTSERHFYFQLSLITLSLPGDVEETAERCFYMDDELVNISRLRRQVLVAKVHMVLGLVFEDAIDQEIFIRLLRLSRVSLCIELLLEFEDPLWMELFIGFLIDCLTSNGNCHDWMDSVLEEEMIDFEYSEILEFSVLKYVITKIKTPNLRCKGLLYAIDRLLVCHLTAPMWLAQLCSSASATPDDINLLFHILGKHEQFDLIASLLAGDEKLRDTLPLDTTKYLQSITSV